MYGCVCVCVNVRVYINTHKQYSLYTYKCVCMSVRVTCMYIYLYVYVNLLQLLLGNESLEKVNEFKLLGIIIQNNLRWTAHIRGISKKIARNIEIILTIKNCLPIDKLTLSYNI